MNTQTTNTIEEIEADIARKERAHFAFNQGIDRSFGLSESFKSRLENASPEEAARAFERMMWR